MTHEPGRMARSGRRRGGLALGSLVLLAALIASWSAPAQAESIPQAVDRMDGTLKGMERKSREADRKVREMDRKLRELEARVRELERTGAVTRQERAGTTASGQGASSVTTPPSGPPESVEASLGLTRTTYELVQRGLASLGFAPGTPDGLVGPKTRAALRRWQAAKGYEATGYLTQAQTDMLVVVGKETQAKAERLTSEGKQPGTVFRDCAECPEMVVLPAGSFMMGSPQSEKGRFPDEGPVHQVRIGKPFAVGRYEVTFAEWDACRRDGGCSHNPGGVRGEGRAGRPVVNVSWDDARQYVRWLSRKTRKTYRLPSESEWEYGARAGTRTRYSWGDSLGRDRANCNGCGSGWDSRQTAPAGSFSPNGYGLHDVHGNVREWVQDCWHTNYKGAPTDGRVWNSERGGDCRFRVMRGGAWLNPPTHLRSATRFRYSTDSRNSFVGFRVARSLD